MTTNHDLARQIEDLVRQHVDALRASAAAAVARAFGAVPPASASARASTPTKPVRTRKQGVPRRAPAELVALGERFSRGQGAPWLHIGGGERVKPFVLDTFVAKPAGGGRREP